MLLSTDAGFKPVRRFRFENMWVSREDFIPIVQAAWNSTPVQIDPFINLHTKLSVVAKALTSWSACFVSDLDLRAAITSELILRLDQAMDSRQLTNEEIQFRAALKVNRLGISALQRTMWRQRSRIQWLREGDASTRFFHAKASARRRKSFIHRIAFDDTVLTEQADKEEAIWNFFQKLIGESRPRSHSLNLATMGIAPTNLADQERPISLEEIRAAILDLPSDKAPGTDGFTSLFFKSCWAIIYPDLLRAIQALEQSSSRHLHLLNSAIMILLPKSPDAAHPRDFRPISLVHFFAKLFTKILALRLRPRMHELVSPCQSAFIKDRVIHDNFVFVKAQTKLFKQKKTPALLLKLDLQKAFDSVSWEFVLEVLEAKGFGLRWRDWIACLFLTSNTRICVNGDLTDKIFHRRGLRQGDPLSPLLFAIATDVLAALFALADLRGALKQNRLLKPSCRISLYADDVVIFVEPYEEELQSVKILMQSFGESSGLFTNYGKSAILPIYCNNIDTSTLSETLQCSVQTFPCTYLGLPLSDKRLCKNDLLPALDKLKGKVKGWNKGNFSFDARLLLVKHVLSALHIYQLLVIDPPVWLIKAIDKVRRGFLWNNDEMAPGGKCLVSWGAVCRPVEFGGLGITDLQRKATALHVRWIWQRWHSSDKPWLDLPADPDQRASTLFNAAVTFSIGDGHKISFWRDPWLDGSSIAETAPHLFKHCTMRHLTVHQALTDGRWIRHLRRNLSPQALIEFTTIHNRLATIQLQPGTPDSVSWRWTTDHKYSATSAYVSQFEGSLRFDFIQTIWRSEAPLKCRIFAWLAALSKCHTADCLAKKSWPHNAACVLCLSEPETALHLLATCPVTIRLWRKILSAANLPAALVPSSNTNQLQGWLLDTSNTFPTAARKSWVSLVHLTWWTLWKERNARIFQNSAAPLSRIFACIVEEASTWRSAGRTRAADLLQRPREPD
jgi:hypothetical protein